MTWKETKVAALQKMFAISGNEVGSDEGVQPYLAAMPAAAAEGLALICAAGKGPVGSIQIDHAPAADGPAWMRYNLAERALDFYRLQPDGVTLEDEKGRLYGNPAFDFEGEATLLLPKGRPGCYRVLYQAAPPALSAATPDDEELPLCAQAATLLPLYMASQLYKDDDLSLATMYRNEFEAGLEAVKTPGGVSGSERFTNERRWL